MTLALKVGARSWDKGGLMADFVPPQLVEVALSHISGTAFEAFSNELMTNVLGISFVPLGGNKDGGADGFIDAGCFESDNSNRFMQASIEEVPERKIRQTVLRLREVGRRPESLIYVTSQVVPRLDQLQISLGDELEINLTIRDQKWIALQANYSSQTKDAVQRHLSPLVEYLKKPGAATLIESSKYISSPSIYVFLRQEVERRSGESSLYEAVVDSLILWALEGTDPDTGILMTREEIKARIISELPVAVQMLNQLFDERIQWLSSKDNSSGREVRWYKADDRFCLPYETRRLVEDENESDEQVRIDANDSFRSRLSGYEDPALGSSEIEKGVLVVNRAVQLAFEREGLSFSYFLDGETQQDSYSTINDHIRNAMEELRVPRNIRARVGEAAYLTIRGSMYRSDERERIFFRRLSRTYGLLFTLRCDPKLIEYFQDMSAEFQLYVGADILVRALSERYLLREDQMIRNMLAMAKESGATLLLTEPALEEVWNHLKSCDNEFINFMSPVEDSITLEIARNDPKILVRSYFYAKLEPEAHGGSPRSWELYIGQFCEYNELHRLSGKETIRKYLQATFSMDYVARGDLEKLVNIEDLEALSAQIETGKKSKNLAKNDALMALSVYAIRDQRRESAEVSEFGYKTWWLTNESMMLRFTHEIEEAHGQSRYMMRPDFLLNYLSLAPSAEKARQTFANVFPTLLSIRLSRRMDEDEFQGLMEKVRGWSDWEPGRRAAAVGELSDALKSDFQKQYLIEISGEGHH
jgi:hypothetical protein